MSKFKLGDMVILQKFDDAWIEGMELYLKGEHKIIGIQGKDESTTTCLEEYQPIVSTGGFVRGTTIYYIKPLDGHIEINSGKALWWPERALKLGKPPEPYNPNHRFRDILKEILD